MPDLLPQPITQWMQRADLRLVGIESLTGGSGSQVQRLDLKSPDNTELQLVLKQVYGAGQGLFAAEAEGLDVLRLQQSEALMVPRVLLQTDNCLLLEYLRPGSPTTVFDQQLATGLALQHRQYGPGFGFSRDTFCGGTRQGNSWQQDGCDFFAGQRLQPLISGCRNKGLLTSEEARQLERLAGRLHQLIPEQPAVLLHGDLWHGNLICGPSGEPALIDPAVYYGWAEAELAMTLMFGGFSDRFYDLYAEQADLLPDWRSRIRLYNLYHYLNHLLLFGEVYHRDVMDIVKYYSD